MLSRGAYDRVSAYTDPSVQVRRKAKTVSYQPSIVAVHGLNGGAKTTWTSDVQNVCWLSDKNLLPKYLKTARILTWGYNANVTDFTTPTSSDRILQHAQTLVADLQSDRQVNCASSLLG
jgi:protein SERAC1